MSIVFDYEAGPSPSLFDSEVVNVRKDHGYLLDAVILPLLLQGMHDARRSPLRYSAGLFRVTLAFMLD